MTSTDSTCPFCNDVGGDLLFEDESCRVVLVRGAEGDAFPGFCRVVRKQHAREMSDLAVSQQRHLLEVVLATEQAVRKVQQPDKINLASLGNVVPHMHWHVIPRWVDDSHFPAPIWAVAARQGAPRSAADVKMLKQALMQALHDRAGKPA